MNKQTNNKTAINTFSKGTIINNNDNSNNKRIGNVAEEFLVASSIHRYSGCNDQTNKQ